MIRYGSVKRPTMFLVSTEIKTASDVARLKHFAKLMEEHNVHGLMIVVLLREMA